ncbi:unnamed protein product [Mytilus edulis]|uniref:Fucolectin tachylectin-4 pentraxin-1 domain-containing protein n=1 Tax=Mytilus edulis TaxID=6550 RepID=A0A8S3RDS1_MYTED|nr:unnamed protein product [Mytilus edulis]
MPLEDTWQTRSSIKHISSLAVDGNENTFTFTQASRNPCWSVDLGKTVHVKQINIINRKDCCGDRLENIEVTVGFDHNKMKNCCNFKGPGKTGQVIMLACKTPIAGRYVTILLRGMLHHLSLAEVQVLGYTVSTYNENCSTPVGDASCYNNMVCVSGICDCEIPAMQYHYPYDKSCKAISTYNENCSTLVGDTSCYNNMVCVSGICDCEIPAMQYHDPYAKSCEARAKYKEPCQTSEDGSNCYSNMICVSGVCGCNTTQYYNPNVHSCNESKLP